MEKNAPKVISLSYDWRYGRLNAINALVCFVLIAVCVTMSISFFSAVYKQVGYNLLLFLCSVLYRARVNVLRLHDINLSGKLAIPIVVLDLTPLALSFVAPMLSPIVAGLGVISSLALLAIPGTKGANRFGEQPDKGSIAGLIAMIVIAILIVALNIYAKYFMPIPLPSGGI